MLYIPTNFKIIILFWQMGGGNEGAPGFLKGELMYVK